MSNQVANCFGAAPLLLSPDEPAATYVSQQTYGERFEIRSAPAMLSQQLTLHVQQHAPLPAAEPMTLNHQQRFFTGWGDMMPPIGNFGQLKTPSLELAWVKRLEMK